MTEGKEMVVGAILTGFVIGALFGTLFVGTLSNNKWEANTIERGLALYCPKTGDFAFTGECDD